MTTAQGRMRPHGMPSERVIVLLLLWQYAVYPLAQSVDITRGVPDLPPQGKALPLETPGAESEPSQQAAFTFGALQEGRL